MTWHMNINAGDNFHHTLNIEAERSTTNDTRATINIENDCATRNTNRWTSFCTTYFCNNVLGIISNEAYEMIIYRRGKHRVYISLPISMYSLLPQLWVTSRVLQTKPALRKRNCGFTIGLYPRCVHGFFWSRPRKVYSCTKSLPPHNSPNRSLRLYPYGKSHVQSPTKRRICLYRPRAWLSVIGHFR